METITRLKERISISSFKEELLNELELLLELDYDFDVLSEFFRDYLKLTSDYEVTNAVYSYLLVAHLSKHRRED